MGKYIVPLDKKIFLEFLIFEWWGDMWQKYGGANKHLHFMQVVPNEYEEAVIYIEQQGQVTWELEDKHIKLLNLLIPNKKYGRKDFILEWHKYHKKWFESPTKLRNKFEY